MIKLVVSGNPIAKNRHRCACINGKPRAYDPQVKGEMQQVQHSLLSSWNELFDDPLSEDAQEATFLRQCDAIIVWMNFYMPINKSDSNAQKNVKLWGLTECSEKPDFDNLAKFYSDCLTGIAWDDDKKIICCISHKVRYSEEPRTEIMIMKSKQDIDLYDHQMNVFKQFSPKDYKELIHHSKALSILLENNNYFFEDTDLLPNGDFLTAASDILIEFANKFATKLKKISNLKEANE